ncbi:MAG: RNA polymerase subunit sigma-24 [Micrococcales bacterium]|nr:RNA polymerase subunit sigma-24 [Micrococcales bacterium]
MTTLESVVREEWGRLIALLLARYRRLDLVEDALGDAVEAAARTWPVDGMPREPAGWLLTAARRRVIDRLRAEVMAQRKEPLLVVAQRDRGADGVRADPGDLVEDDLLRLVLMCCHEDIALESAAALALRLVVGVSTPDIARLFLVSGPTMAARLTRAKRKVVADGILFAIPTADVLPTRLDGVARVAYLAFTAGYAAGSGDAVLRAETAGEAIRLVRATRGLVASEPVLEALLALMLLQHSRRDARVDEDGSLVLLPDQDRTRWHHDEIAEGLGLLAAIDPARPLTSLAASYLVQARIAAEHARAVTPQQTDWGRIVENYDLLLSLGPSPAAAVARAVAVAEADGPKAGLRALDGLADQLPRSHRPHAVEAELRRRAGEREAALAAYDRAISLCDNEAERAHLHERRTAVAAHSADLI